MNEVAQYDHCAGQFKDNHRKKENFIWCNCVMLDVDNDSENPDEWKTPQDVQETFSNVQMVVTYSEHHLLPKGEKPAKPRFHLYFPLSENLTTDDDVCWMKEALRRVFPDFDKRALDSARFFQGTENPRAEYFPGTICIDQWLEQHPELLEEQPEVETMSASSASYTYSPSYSGSYGRSVLDDIGTPIHEGTRNDTLYKFACSVLKLFGSTDGRARAAFEDRIRDCTGTPMKQSELNASWNSAVKWYEGSIRSSSDYVSPEDFNKKTQPQKGGGAVAAEKTEWGQIREFSRADLPEFPVDALPPVVRNYVSAIATSVQVPPEMPGCLSLAVLALLFQRRYKIQVSPDWSEPLCLFVALVAPPADRKSSVFTALTDVIDAYEEYCGRRDKVAIQQNQSKRRQLEAKLRSAEAKATNDKLTKKAQDDAFLDSMNLTQKLAEHEDLVAPRWMLDDSTPERMVQVMAQQNGAIAIFSDEGGVFKQMRGKYSKNGDSQLEPYLKGYSGGTIKTDRMSREGESIRNARLTMGLTIQPKVLKTLMGDDEMRGDGLVGRFIMVDCHQKSEVGYRRPNPEPIPTEVKDAYEAFVEKELNRDELTRRDGYKLLYPDGDADRIRSDYQWEMEQTLRPGEKWYDGQDWAGKNTGRMCRIAALFHCVEHSDKGDADEYPISGETMERAIKVADFIDAHALAIYNTDGETSASDSEYVRDRIRDHVRTTKKTRLARRDVLRLCRRFKRVAELDDPLEDLCDRNMVAIEKEQQTRGAPKQWILLNPAAFFD
ncbi:MAG: DUF3987 domain-containing protein [Clostridiales bacterium]|nr:DUF3987 domain-containing protein [Clostridiales bacterium]